MDTSKVFIVCCGSINDHYEYLVFIFDVGEYGGEEMAVLPMHPTLRFGWDDFSQSAICILRDKLYIFEGCHRSVGDQVKGVFTFPLSEGVSNLPMKKNMMRKEAVGMNGTKIWPKAMVTPDGGKILVFSSLIEVYCCDENVFDFEFYYPDVGIWHALPNLPVSAHEGPNYERIEVQSFTFMNENVFFLRTSVGVFTLDIQKPTVWKRGGFRGDECIPRHSGYSLLLIERKICVVYTCAFDIRVRGSRLPEGSVPTQKEDIFATLDYTFPNLSEFTRGGYSFESTSVTLLEHEGGTKFKVCFLHNGINKETKRAEFMLQVYKTYLSPCTKELTANRKKKVREDKIWWKRKRERLLFPSTFKLQSFKIVVEEDFDSLHICSFSSVC